MGLIVIGSMSYDCVPHKQLFKNIFGSTETLYPSKSFLQTLFGIRFIFCSGSRFEVFCVFLDDWDDQHCKAKRHKELVGTEMGSEQS